MIEIWGQKRIERSEERMISRRFQDDDITNLKWVYYIVYMLINF